MRCSKPLEGLRVALFALALSSSALSAQAPPPAAPGTPAPGTPMAMPRDPVAEQLFPPELVMDHQSAIGLTDAQRQTLIRELQRLQTEVIPLQFEIRSTSEGLVELLAGDRVAEEQAVARAGRLMELERQVKLEHLKLLVRIKNLLTADQQRQLEARRPRPGAAPVAKTHPRP
jgi:Spy/CpxP family protein refolding chaperone